MLNIWGLVNPTEAQCGFGSICLDTLLDSICWTKIDTCVKQNLFDNVNSSNPNTDPLLFMKRTDAYIVNVDACKL